MLVTPVENGIKAPGIMASPVMPFMIGIAPEKIRDDAEAMADASGIAAGGRGWSWLPS